MVFIYYTFLIRYFILKVFFLYVLLKCGKAIKTDSIYDSIKSISTYMN